MLATVSFYTNYKQATVIVWSSVGEEIGRHSLHREEICGLAVASDGTFVFSLGGETDNRIIVWDVKNKKPICSMLYSFL